MNPTFGRLLHLGNVVVDLVLTVPSVPERGADTLATSTRATAGGGFNVMAAAARQGLRVAHGGLHGTGPFGDIARAALRAEGVDILQPTGRGRDTGFVVCLVDDEGERTFVTSPGIETALGVDDLVRIRPAPDDAIHLSGYSLVHPGVLAALSNWSRVIADDVPVFFDPGPLIASAAGLPESRLLSRIDWFTCSAGEVRALTGAAAVDEAIDRLAARTGRRGVIVRTGATGCLLLVRGERVVRVAGFPVTAVDSNGAGDAHTGVFIAALAHGIEPVRAARVANAAAALAVTERGPATAPTSARLAQFLADGGSGRRTPRT